MSSVIFCHVLSHILSCPQSYFVAPSVIFCRALSHNLSRPQSYFVTLSSRYCDEIHKEMDEEQKEWDDAIDEANKDKDQVRAEG